MRDIGTKNMFFTTMFLKIWITCAAATLLAQGDASAVPALAKMLIDEESVRVRSKVAEGLAQRAWPLAEDARAALRNTLPAGYALDGGGRVTKR